MRVNRRLRAVRVVMAAWLVLAATLLWCGGSASAKPPYALIEGSGSSWAANAVQQWISDVSANGIKVVFGSTGSAQGRIDFANRTTDFGVSDIGYQGTDPATGAADTSQGRAYAYLPIVAGGTALPYNIVANGTRIVNLRLSGATIAKIFTQKITNWDDPAVTADNNGRKLPSLPIIPVQHSEGSGSSYQFTRYLSKEFPSIWTTGASEYFPPAAGSAVAENGSDGVINFLTSAAANGAIGFDEYSYALGAGLPVAKVLNSNGYYTLPNQYNVAVALTQAQINMDKTSPDYLLQNLDNVYVYGDPRVYPMSSYSYAIIPTASNDARMTPGKRQTLADYLDYSVCQGQGEMGHIGYSPLPINLVQASFDQVGKLHTADPSVDISALQVTSCHNPTFIAGHPTENYLAKVAPFPPSCDKQGAGPCVGNGNTGQSNPGSNGSVPTTGNSPGGSNGGGSNGGGGSNNGGGSNGGGTGSGGGGSGGNSGSGAKVKPSTSALRIDPATGQLVGGGSGDSSNSGGSPSPASQNLAAPQSSNTNTVLALVIGGLVLGVLAVPAFVGTRLSKR